MQMERIFMNEIIVSFDLTKKGRALSILLELRK